MIIALANVTIVVISTIFEFVSKFFAFEALYCMALCRVVAVFITSIAPNYLTDAQFHSIVFLGMSSSQAAITKRFRKRAI